MKNLFLTQKTMYMDEFRNIEIKNTTCHLLSTCGHQSCHVDWITCLTILIESIAETCVCMDRSETVANVKVPFNPCTYNLMINGRTVYYSHIKE